MSQSEHRYFGQPRYMALRLVSDKQYGRKAAQLLAAGDAAVASRCMGAQFDCVVSLPSKAWGKAAAPLSSIPLGGMHRGLGYRQYVSRESRQASSKVAGSQTGILYSIDSIRRH